MAEADLPNLGILKGVTDVANLFAGPGKITEDTTTSGYANLSLAKIAETSFKNATDPTQVQSVVDNILKRAAAAFAPVIGQGKAAGLYNSSTLSLLSGRAQTDAVGAASKAVLDYQSDQLKTAANASSAIGQLNKTTTRTQAPQVPNAASSIAAYGGLAGSLLKNAKSIREFVTNPLETSKNLLGFGTTAEDVAAANAGNVSSGVNMAGDSFATGGSSAGIGAGSSGGVNMAGGGVGDAINFGNSSLGATPQVSIEPLQPISETLDNSSDLLGSITAGGGESIVPIESPVGIGEDFYGSVGDAIAPGTSLSELTGGVVNEYSGGGASAIESGLDYSSSLFETSGALAEAAVDTGVNTALETSGELLAEYGGSAAAEVGTGAGALIPATQFFVDGPGNQLLTQAWQPLESWIVCTELMRQGKMPKRYWIYGSKRFANYWEYGKRGYYLWAIPCVKHLRAKPDSLLSKVLEVVFNWRAEYVAACGGLKGAKKTWYGAAITAVLWPVCAFLAVTVCPFLEEESTDWNLVYPSRKE